MRVNQEIDAMLTIGLDPVEVLVLPRLFALLRDLAYADPVRQFHGDVRRWAYGVGSNSVSVFHSSLLTFLRLHRGPSGSSMIKSPFFCHNYRALIGC